jgi:hypothetical protein
MSYLILSMAILAVIHFIYESIIAPSLRLSIRYELFCLRDQLRQLKIEHGDELDDKHFCYLQDSINTIISALPRIEIVAIAHMKTVLENDDELRNRLNVRQEILDDCIIPEMTEIRRKSIALSIRALGVNGGMWSVYIIPIMAVGGVYRSIERRIKALVSLSDLDIDKIAPRIHHNGTFQVS